MQASWPRMATALALLSVATVSGAADRNERNGRDERRRGSDSSKVASVWFDALYDVIRSEGTAPPPASRIYGLAAVGLYEAVAPGSADNRSLVGQLTELSGVPEPARHDKKYHWPAVGNAALARTIRGLFASLEPANAQAIDALEADFNARFRAVTKKKDFERSVSHGQAVADAILAWAAADGYATFNNCGYLPAEVDGRWEPTPPANALNPLQPCWGRIRTMALGSALDCAPPPPPAFSVLPGSACHTAASEVYDTSLSLTPEQEVIADFWADNPGATGTPPGHWIAIVGQIARHDRLSLVDAAEAYARVGIAVHDAFIECWHAKYAYNMQRPVTYIRANIDPGWLPRLATPPFPTFTSGHSTQSGAAATVLSHMFGTRRFTDTLSSDHGLVPALEARTFESFAAAAAEAAVSRLYGGIHFAFDNDAGLVSGECIGQRINEGVRFRE